MCSWFPAPRYVTGVSLFFALTLQFPNSFPASLNFLGLCLFTAYVMTSTLMISSIFIFFLFRGSNICQNHIQSNFYCNGHSDSPYIDSCLNLSTTATFLSPRWPLWRGSTVFIFTGSLLRVPFSVTDWLVANMFYKARATAVHDVWNQVVLLPCSSASLAVLHGSSSTWFQTSCCRRAELNS